MEKWIIEYTETEDKIEVCFFDSCAPKYYNNAIWKLKGEAVGLVLDHILDDMSDQLNEDHELIKDWDREA